MQGRIVLISDDNDFFEYILPKLTLRKSDEIYRFTFDEVPDKLHLLYSSLLIINSENSQDKTLELLGILKDTPVLVFSFNEDEKFMVEAYKAGMFGYITLSTSDEEIKAKLMPALNIASSIEKNKIYRELLVQNNLISKNNEVFLDTNNILENELSNIKKTSASVVFMAISPNEKNKSAVQSNQIETAILTNIRKNDMLINYANNKYFLFLYNTDVKKAEKIWQKIASLLPQKIYAGLAVVGKKSRQQLVNEVLNKLHESINRDISTVSNTALSGSNFKSFRQDFIKNMEQIISPVFYHVQQLYNDRLFGMKIEQSTGDGYGVLSIKSKYTTGSFRITCPGLATINIDITYQPSKLKDERKNKFPPEMKRITLEPDELEAGLLEDLLEQFIVEFKNNESGD